MAQFNVVVFVLVIYIARSQESSLPESSCFIQTKKEVTKSLQSISPIDSNSIIQDKSLLNRSSAQADTELLVQRGAQTLAHLFPNATTFLKDYFGLQWFQGSGPSWKALRQGYWFALQDMLLIWLTYVIVAMLVYLCCFHRSPERFPFDDLEDPSETMKSHHFGCLRTPRICCCAFFCPIIQWADTMKLARVLEIPLAIAMFAACAALNSMTLTGVMIQGAFTSLLIIYYRQKIREKFGLKSWTCQNCLIDFVYVCFCPCCAVAQEAQALKLSPEGLDGGGADA